MATELARLEDCGEVSRRDTTLVKLAYLAQLPFGAHLGARGWVHRALRLRVAESAQDRHLAADIVRRRHYAGRWPCPPRTLILTYLADLEGIEPGPAGAAGLVMVALLPGNYHCTKALDLAQYEVLTLVRTWRADDLVPAVTPDLTPEILRRVVKGERRGPLCALREEWTRRKCRVGGLTATSRLLATYADPELGHDGATYRAAGAIFCGRARGGKLLFAWGLDEEVRDRLTALGRAVEERNEQ